MLITKRSYQKKYVIGGTGIFSFIGNFLVRIFSRNAAKQLASTALQAGKTAAKDIGMKAVDVGKTVAIDAGKKLVEKAAKKLTTSKSQVANVVDPQIAPPEEITKKVNEVIAMYVDTSAINLNKLIDGSSIKHTNTSNANCNSRSSKTDKWIGFKNYINLFSSSIKNDDRYIEIYR